VEILSRFKWQVTSPFKGESTYVVEKLIDDGDGETHCFLKGDNKDDNFCEFWEDDCDPKHINHELFCRECRICVDNYSCQCQKGKKGYDTSICWHIHKVHMWNLEVT